MAFSTRRFVKHIDKYDVTHRLEIQEDGFGGSESAIHTTGQVFQFEHETHASEDEEILNVYENPVQKGSIELFLRIDNSTDRTLIEDIFNGDEDDFRLVWKIDGTIFWTGTILNDMLEYPESDFPYMAKLWAKDFSRLEGVDYTLDDTRQTLITTFADLIDNLGYSLDIETHTSWTTQDTTDATDFLQQIFHETKALRNFGRTGDEADTTITAYEALEMMCRNFGCVVRQEGGVFKIIQYSEYETPTGVNVTVYDSTGTEKTAATSTDLSLDTSTNDITITDRSITRAFKAIRRARNKFDHRTEVQNIQFPSRVETDGSTNISETFSQFFVSDGDQVINLDVRGTADHGALPENSKGRVQIKAGSYWWNDATRQWVGTNTVNEFDLTVWTLQKARGFVPFQTETTPSDADGQLEITFLNAIDDNGAADATVYDEIVFSIDNQVGEENTTSIDYVLTQTGGYSSVFELAETWFGDGPIGYAVSALRHSSADGDTTSESWQRRGTTTGYRNLHENLLKEIIDLQRGNRIKTDGNTLGEDYDPEKIITYRSKSLAYTGGRFDGEVGDWLPVLFEINVVTGSDTFEDLPKFTDETGSGSGSTGGSTGGGGLSQPTADNRYFKQSSLLSEASDLPTLRSNIGLGTTDDVTFNTVAATGGDSSEWNTGYDQSLTGGIYAPSTGLITLTRQVSPDIDIDIGDAKPKAGTLITVTGPASNTVNHDTPASVASAQINPGVIVVQSLDFDTFGHATSASSIDLSSSFVEPGDNISTLTNDAGYVTTDNDTITRVGVDAGSLQSGDIFLLEGSGITLSQIGNDITIASSVASLNGGDKITINGTNIDHDTSMVTAGSYGGSVNTIPSFTVDTYGHLTQADEVLDLDSFYTRSTDLVPKSGGTFTGDVTFQDTLFLDDVTIMSIDSGDGTQDYHGTYYFHGEESAHRFWARNDTNTAYVQAKLQVYSGSSYDTVLHTGNYDTEIGYQTLSFNGTNNELTITDGNTVTLSLQVTSSSQLDPDVVTGSKIESNTIDPGNINNTGTFTGSFTNGDGNTVNVTNGLITSIMI